MFVLALSFATVEPCFGFGGLVYSAQHGGGDSSNGAFALTGLCVAVALPFAVSGTTKGLKNQAQRDNDFYKRFQRHPRGMLKDLHRLSGPHFQWTLDHHTRVKPEQVARFKCEVARDLKRYGRLLRKARSKRRSDVIAIGDYLSRMKDRLRSRSSFLDRCQLYERYTQHPSRFEREMTQGFSGVDYQWVKKKYLLMRSDAVLNCELKRKRRSLKSAFQGLRTLGYAEIEKLDNLIREIKIKPTRACY